VRHEFSNRVVAQRAILRAVNQKGYSAEQLFGLSSKAIDRWVSVNRIEPTLRLVQMMRDASDKLFFLANRSQEQVSEQYAMVCSEVAAACQAIENEPGSAPR
jgi:hypothetical protein